MSRVSSSPPNSIRSSSSGSQTTGGDLRDVDVNQFLDLLIAELQNQDPLDPLDNQEMLQQIGQIREISSNNRLSDTLEAVMTGQNLATASGLIGKKISALTDDGKNVEGTVDRVSVQTSNEKTGERTIRVHVGDTNIELDNIREIVDE